MDLEQINKLLDLDEKTRKEVAFAHNEKKRMQDKIAEEEKHLSEVAWSAAKKQVAEKEQELNQEVASEKARLEKSFQINKKKLEMQFLDHRQEWIQMLKDFVINVKGQHE